MTSEVSEENANENESGKEISKPVEDEKIALDDVKVSDTMDVSETKI